MENSIESHTKLRPSGRRRGKRGARLYFREIFGSRDQESKGIQLRSGRTTTPLMHDHHTELPGSDASVDTLASHSSKLFVRSAEIYREHGWSLDSSAEAKPVPGEISSNPPESQLSRSQQQTPQPIPSQEHSQRENEADVDGPSGKLVESIALDLRQVDSNRAILEGLDLHVLASQDPVPTEPDSQASDLYGFSSQRFKPHRVEFVSQSPRNSPPKRQRRQTAIALSQLLHKRQSPHHWPRRHSQNHSNLDQQSESPRSVHQQEKSTSHQHSDESLSSSPDSSSSATSSGNTSSMLIVSSESQIEGNTHNHPNHPSNSTIETVENRPAHDSSQRLMNDHAFGSSSGPGTSQRIHHHSAQVTKDGWSLLLAGESDVIMKVIGIFRFITDQATLEATRQDMFLNYNSRFDSNMYDIMLEDDQYKGKVLLSRSLNILVDNGQLALGSIVRIGRISNISLVRQGSSSRPVDNDHCILLRKLDVVFSVRPTLLNMVSSEDVPFHPNLSSRQKELSPSSLKFSFYMPLYSEDTFGELKSVSERHGVGMIPALPSHIIKIAHLGPRLKQREITIAGVVKAISKIDYYGKFDGVRYPIKFTFLLEDDTGTIPIVVWNSKCLDYYGDMIVGMVTVVSGFRVKRSHDPQFELELSVNSSNPEGFISKSNLIQAPWLRGVTPLFSPLISQELLFRADGEYIDFAGVILDLSPTYRERNNPETCAFYLYRWIRLDDGKSQPVVLKLYANSISRDLMGISKGMSILISKVSLMSLVRQSGERHFYLVSTPFSRIYSQQSVPRHSILNTLAVEYEKHHGDESRFSKSLEGKFLWHEVPHMLPNMCTTTEMKHLLPKVQGIAVRDVSEYADDMKIFENMLVTIVGCIREIQVVQEVALSDSPTFALEPSGPLSPSPMAASPTNSFKFIIGSVTTPNTTCSVTLETFAGTSVDGFFASLLCGDAVPILRKHVDQSLQEENPSSIPNDGAPKSTVAILNQMVSSLRQRRFMFLISLTRLSFEIVFNRLQGVFLFESEQPAVTT